jgi:hypothetical protein
VSAVSEGGDRKRVSTVGYWIAAAILVVGIVAAGVWMGLALAHLLTGPDDFTRISVPGERRVELAEGEWTIYVESPSDSREHYSASQVAVSDPDGRSVRLIDVPWTAIPYPRTDEREGEPLAAFEVTRPGVYSIEAGGEARSSLVLAVGEAPNPFLLGGALGSVLLGGLTVVLAGTIFAVTLVRRSSVRRSLGPTSVPPTGPPTGPPMTGPPMTGSPPVSPPPPVLQEAPPPPPRDPWAGRRPPS